MPTNRHYCTARLATLYAALKLSHGRGKYQKKKVEVHTISEERHLHVPLVSAERAWAMAMDLKKQNERSVDLRRKQHAVRRLRKASVWASELARFAAARCDQRSALEAEAYATWMAACVLQEKEGAWEAALAKYGRCRRLLQELARVGEIEQQTACLQMIEETVEPGLRFCSYQLSRQRGGAAEPDVAALVAKHESAEEMAGLQARLDALAASAARRAEAAATTFSWQGREYPVKQVRCCLLVEHRSLFVAGEFFGLFVRQYGGV